MDQRPIGVFDSGLGGLTMVKELCRLLPGEDIIYLGDTGRVPYGTRSRDTIIEYADQDAAFLASMDIKAMVIACNTVCGVAFDKLKFAYDMPMYEVVKTPAKVAAETTKNGNIGIIGTAATVRSGAYERVLYEISASLNVYSVACPLFVPLAEEGWTKPDNEAANLIAHHYLYDLRNKGIDTLILGCTHYSLLTDIIARAIGYGVTLIDSGAQTAKYVATNMKERGILREDGENGEHRGTQRYYVTDSASDFAAHAAKFLESDVQGMVKQITLF